MRKKLVVCLFLITMSFCCAACGRESNSNSFQTSDKAKDDGSNKVCYLKISEEFTQYRGDEVATRWIHKYQYNENGECTGYESYLTLTKYFYKGLSKNIHSMNLKEVCSLINLFEADVNNTLVTNYYGKFDINQEFMKAYSEIQNMFFEELAESLELEFDTVYQAFLNYTINMSYKEELNLSFLDEEKNLWLNKYKEAYESALKSSIQADYHIFLNNTQ